MITSIAGQTYRNLLTSNRFIYGAEVVTTRGYAPIGQPDKLQQFAEALLADSRIGWISITDNPGGAPMLPPDWLAGLVAKDKGRVVVHLTCKDVNRNAQEAAAWRYAAEGFQNILAMTGDLPTTGFGSKSPGVFDLDSVSLIKLLSSMNAGLTVAGRGGKLEILPKTDFFVGCAVSPFKRYERELMPQYFKLLQKLHAGAHWVISQLGYDMRKFNEIKLWLAAHGIDVPVIGNVYLLNKGVAKLFNSGKLAGCVVSDELVRQIEKYAAGEDKGRKFCQELAAKQLAVFKGLGFAAGYLGGMAKADSFSQIIELSESYGENDWRDFIKEIQFSQPDEFFLFEHDPATGLGDPERVNPAYLKSLENSPKSPEVTLGYRLSRYVHAMAFTRDRRLWGLMKGFFARRDAKPGMLGSLAYSIERHSKHLMFDCEDCGDCSLPDCAYLCPKGACSKSGRNGPCGGSLDGRCELGDKECVWTRAYERLKYYRESQQLLDRPAVFYNAALKNTSSWANTYLDRDHNAPPKTKDESPGS